MFASILPNRLGIYFHRENSNFHHSRFKICTRVYRCIVLNGLLPDSRKAGAAGLCVQSRLNGGGAAGRRALNIGAGGASTKTIEID